MHTGGRPLAMIVVGVAAWTTAAVAQDRRITRPESVTERRLALVIGNQAYPTMALKNAAQDARDIQAALTDTGFQVDLLVNATKQQMDFGVGRFVDRLQPGDVALVYFAGHGVQIDGENFLLPVDVAAADEPSVKYSSYSAALLHDRLAARGTRLKILILDACRDNPFRSSRSASQGLAAMTASGRGTFIAFATAPGRTASDNINGRNGLFTSALLEALREPGLDIGQVFDRVRERVDGLSRGSQTPFVNSGVVGRFLFRPATAPSSPSLRFPPTVILTPALAAERAKCEKGEPSACALLGYAFYSGDGVGVEKSIAAALYERACNGGDGEGCRLAALMASTGDGVARDASRSATFSQMAVNHYDRDCRAGKALECNQLAFLYQTGGGVAMDHPRAAFLYERSCDLGYHDGCDSAAQMFLEETNRSRDARRAVTLFTRACDGGIVRSCIALGGLYAAGKDISKDTVKAIAAYRRACELSKDGYACTLWKELAGKQ